MADEGRQRQIGFLLVGGGAGFLFGLFCLFWGFVLRSQVLFGLGSLAILLGIGSAGFGLAIGLIQAKNTGAGPQRPPQEARVQARYAINGIGEMIFDNFDYDAEDARFYVRLQYLDGKREELECGRPVFDQCGEGMRGIALVEGGWLSQFAHLADTDETRAAYRDW